MRLDSTILSLPASILLLLIASHSAPSHASDNDQSPGCWPFNILSFTKCSLVEPPNQHRDPESIIENASNGRSPVGVMKMSHDEGEKFYMEYWQYGGDSEQSPMLSMASSHPALRTRDAKEEARLLANTSTPISYRPPLPCIQKTSSIIRISELEEACGVVMLLLLHWLCLKREHSYAQLEHQIALRSDTQTAVVLRTRRALPFKIRD